MSIVRSSLVLATVVTAAYFVRRALMSKSEKAVETVKTNVKEINKDLARKDEALTASLGEIAHRVG